MSTASPEPEKAASSNSVSEDAIKIPPDDLKTISASSKQALMQPSVTMTMYVPTTAVGALIGRKGQTIANIQKLASSYGSSSASNQPVRVTIVSQETQESIPFTFTELDFSDSQWTPVVIRGVPVATMVAASKIEEIAEQVDDVILDLPVNRTKHASIVGKRGIGIVALSAETNVRIMIPSKNFSSADVIQLEGELASVQRCLITLLPIAAKAKPPKQEEKTVTLSQAPSQTKIRNIGRKFDCTIRKKKGDDNGWLFTVAGNSIEQVEGAIGALQKHVDDKETSNGTPNTPKRGGRGGRGRGPTNRGTPRRSNASKDGTPGSSSTSEAPDSDKK